MRVLLLLACALASCVAAPQSSGYNYQSQADGLSDYQLQQQLELQQLLQQEEYLKQELQKELLKQQQQQQQVLSQTHTVADNGGYQFANQLVQQAQQLVQYEQQEQQQLQQQQQQQSTQSEIKIESEQVKIEQEPQQFGGVDARIVNQYIPPAQIVEEPTEQFNKPQYNEQPHTHYIPPAQQQQQQQEYELSLPVRQPLPQPQPEPLQQPHQQPQPLPQPQPHLLPQQQPQPHYESQQHYQSQQPAGVKYNKEFFYLSAPQDDYDIPQNLQNELQQIKKNLRVVFIKTPEHNGITDAALALAKQSANSQTAIYVLTKQHDAGDLAQKLQQVRAENSHKPEVIFVKYRTPQEAEQAQRTIQAQYEALDGPNHFNHEGSVASHSFIGSTQNGAALPAAEAPATKYLPSAHKA